MTARVYDDLATFYADRPERRGGETDYGIWWREDRTWPVYRLSWVRDTGELYAVRQLDGGVTGLNGADALDAGEPIGLVEVLAVVADERVLASVLDGWADVCGSTNSLGWVRDRIRQTCGRHSR